MTSECAEVRLDCGETRFADQEASRERHHPLRRRAPAFFASRRRLFTLQP